MKTFSQDTSKLEMLEDSRNSSITVIVYYRDGCNVIAKVYRGIEADMYDDIISMKYYHSDAMVLGQAWIETNWDSVLQVIVITSDTVDVSTYKLVDVVINTEYSTTTRFKSVYDIGYEEKFITIKYIIDSMKRYTRIPRKRLASITCQDINVLSDKDTKEYNKGVIIHQ